MRRKPYIERTGYCADWGNSVVQVEAILLCKLRIFVFSSFMAIVT